jgi:hypothetical protein
MTIQELAALARRRLALVHAVPEEGATDHIRNALAARVSLALPRHLLREMFDLVGYCAFDTSILPLSFAWCTRQ